MGDLFRVLDKLTIYKVALTDEEVKEFEPFLINRWFFFARGLERHACFLNKYSFTLDKASWFKLAQQIIPKKKYFFKYIKKSVKKEYNFFEKDIAKYYKFSYKRATECLEILTKEQTLELALKFGYDKKRLKSLGIEYEHKKKVMGKWW